MSWEFWIPAFAGMTERFYKERRLFATEVRLKRKKYEYEHTGICRLQDSLDSRLRGNDIEGVGMTDACSSFDGLRTNGNMRLRTNGNMRLRANGRKRNIVMICIIISLI